MPRRTRTHYFEAMYHVMLRGNYRQIIFNDDNDRLYFYSLFKQITEKFNCKIHDTAIPKVSVEQCTDICNLLDQKNP